MDGAEAIGGGYFKSGLYFLSLSLSLFFLFSWFFPSYIHPSVYSQSHLQQFIRSSIDDL